LAEAKEFYGNADGRDKILVLLAMSVGLEIDLLRNDRLEQHVKVGDV